MTAEEKAMLAAGKAVEKTHVSYWRFHPQQVYWQGPMRVEPAPKGKYTFRNHGHWVQYDEHGGIVAESDYRLSTQGNAGHSRLYYPAGVLSADVDTWPTVLNGDSVLVTRIVNFRHAQENDTLFVERWYRKDGRFLKPSVRTFDLAGRRPVPKNWKGQP
ncbi:hypothetical protein MUN81_11035 [Hymenobacter sp. 5317J-9]|uniref:hypothetical protein n=1 Tax=Hymenobacter sp. 5317J-9 TaxID=2932250 RepID=UPI001FD6D42A|nr:hypothetical protein [Hymenobacter sp. 5317J-9]UOR00011.1 hypothetical protein MUN81_11035 [Hymenobacter sp. 5317J-9]